MNTSVSKCDDNICVEYTAHIPINVSSVLIERLHCGVNNKHRLWQSKRKLEKKNMLSILDNISTTCNYYFD